MKRYIQIACLLIGAMLIVAVCLPNFVLNGTVFAKEDSKASTIGGIEIEGLKASTLESTLQTAITQWQTTAVVVSGGNTSIMIDTNQLSFDISAAISQYELLTKKPWYAFWQKDKVVHVPIPVTINETIIHQIESVDIWESEKTLQTITSHASYLRNHEIEAVVNDTLMQAEERLGFQVAEIPTDVRGIREIIASIEEVVLVPDKPVSFLSLLGEQTGAVNGATLNFLASTLYSVVLQTDYEIIERHSQQVLPSYLQEGIEADVNVALNKDLQFINRSKHTSKLKTTLEGNQLKIEMFAPTKDKEITVRVSKDKIVKPRIVYRYSDDLKVGQERVEQEGQEGFRIEVYRSVVENGTTDEQLVSKDYYAPENRIVTRSTKEPVPVTTATQNIAADPDLQIDLDGNGLSDTESSAKTNHDTQVDGPEIVYGYYDKGGNFVQTSP
ncbi:VanW family protein [Lysinibacillus sphaericus]|uniref:VanW family protein n=1 Tax=Lysinibacillus sphaericus TaxID=1421 RepID=UPI003D054718